jgi:hypothetical protein
MLAHFTGVFMSTQTVFLILGVLCFIGFLFEQYFPSRKFITLKEEALKEKLRTAEIDAAEYKAKFYALNDMLDYFKDILDVQIKKGK